MTDTAAAGSGITDAGAGAAAGTDDAGTQLTPEQQAAADTAAAERTALESAAVETFKATLPKPPEKYDLKLPETSALDATLIERTGAIARDLGLSNEQAQKMLDAVAGEVSTHHAAAIEAYKPGGTEWKKQVEGWETTALADTEIGGTADALTASGELGKKVLATFGTEPLYRFLHDTGFGSHPDVVRFLRRIGKAMDEGALVRSADEPGEVSLADKLYGKKPDAAT